MRSAREHGDPKHGECSGQAEEHSPDHAARLERLLRDCVVRGEAQRREHRVERTAHRAALRSPRAHATRSATMNASEHATAPNGLRATFSMQIIVCSGVRSAVQSSRSRARSPDTRVTKRRRDAHVRRDAGEHQVRDPVRPELEVEVSGEEHALAGLVDHPVAEDGLDVIHDVPARLVPNEHATAGAHRSDRRTEVPHTELLRSGGSRTVPVRAPPGYGPQPRPPDERRRARASGFERNA